MMRLFLAIIALFASLSLAGCIGDNTAQAYNVSTGGDAHQGRKVIEAYGCGSCHTIPGINDARGLVGPPLYFMSRRTMIAGELPNTPDNLVKWLKSPQSIEAGTAMPTLGLSDQEAKDAAAYLYTLK